MTNETQHTEEELDIKEAQLRKIGKAIYIGIWVAIGYSVIKKASVKPANNFYIISDPLNMLGGRRPW